MFYCSLSKVCHLSLRFFSFSFVFHQNMNNLFILDFVSLKSQPLCMYFNSYMLPVDTFNGQFLLDPVFFFFIVNNINTPSNFSHKPIQISLLNFSCLDLIQVSLEVWNREWNAANNAKQAGLWRMTGIHSNHCNRVSLTQQNMSGHDE